MDPSVSITLSIPDVRGQVSRAARQIVREISTQDDTGQVHLRDSRGRFVSLESVVSKIYTAASNSLEKAGAAIQNRVEQLVPYWRRGLPVKRTTGEGGAQTIFGEGVVFKTHELNGQWKKLPPHAPLKMWAEGKLGLSGKEAESAAWAIAKKIRERGLTLPNVEGRGQMIQRTKAEMESSRFHFKAFSSSLKRELSAEFGSG